MNIGLQLFLNTVAAAGIYILMSVGLSLIYRVSKVFHFAHGIIYTIAAYILFTLMIEFHIPLLPAVFLAVIVSAFTGLSVDMLLYQPLTKRNATGATLMIASLGAYIFFENLIALIYGADTQILLPGVQKTIIIAGNSVTITQLAEICIFFIILTAIIWIRRKYVGLWLRSTSNDSLMAITIGLPTTKIRTIVFLVGSALAGLAACLASLDSGAEPHMGMKALFVAIVAVFFGGSDIFLAPVIGALFFSVLQVTANYLLSSRWESTTAFIVLLLFMAILPEGILSRTRRVEERTAH